MSSSPDDVTAETADAAACEPLACTTCRSRKLKCKWCVGSFRHLTPSHPVSAKPVVPGPGLPVPLGRLRLTPDPGDRLKPACSRCSRISSECVYPEARRKPAFKRRNVKELEERLGMYISTRSPLLTTH
jgi:hypothetical protein